MGDGLAQDRLVVLTNRVVFAFVRKFAIQLARRFAQPRSQLDDEVMSILGQSDLRTIVRPSC
jgi:hypothetical protein